MEKYEVIIIGAGSSGIICALNSSKKTLLIEASDRIGKKILATGNGKCNITNNVIDAAHYNTPLVSQYFKKFNTIQTLKYFENLGIHTYADNEGRRYPLSNSANTVLDLLLKALSLKKQLRIIVNSIPLSVAKVNCGFSVNTKDEVFTCKKLVIATGGNSGMQYLNQLKIDYINFKPSLVGLKTTKNKGLAGVRVSNVRVKYGNFDENGEILFKEDGISGIVIFNLSAYLARSNINSGKIKIDLLANIQEDDLLNMLCISMNNNSYYTLVDVLEGFLHKSLAKNILEKLALDKKYAKDCTQQDVNRIVNLIKDYVVDFVGYSDNNQVHTGGVDLKNLDDNLQHKQIQNLYFIGEVVNVDGVCGGYNLQWAWTSGKIVGDCL
ncbi:MAG: aminoacetone oxidase family FAD-binding enzyme [Clostridia bacterium]|nr:aminoacetone oxidase family FAD-binding enzyme [Clostridia bacterium]